MAQDDLEARISETLTPRAQKQRTAVDMMKGFFQDLAAGKAKKARPGMRASDMARERRMQGGGGSAGISDEQVSSLADLFREFAQGNRRSQMDQNLQQIVNSPTGPASGSAQVSPGLNLGSQVLGPQQQLPLANFLAPQVNLPLPPMPIPGQGLPGFQFANALG